MHWVLTNFHLNMFGCWAYPEVSVSFAERPIRFCRHDKIKFY